MITNNNSKLVFKKLRQILLTYDYAILIDLFTSGRINTAPWMTCPVNMIQKLPDAQRILLQLFHLGEWTENVNLVIDDDILGALEEMNFLERDGELTRTKNYIIYTYNGMYIIGQKWKPGEDSSYDQVWIGEDSLCLARLLPVVKGKKVLDLCAGTGILGIIMASRGADVTSIEINPHAVKLCKCNILINNLEDRITVHEGSLYEPVKGQRFDLILANPPYIPLIDEKESGLLFGSAGDDGLKILRAIVYEVSEYLTPSGKVLMIAGGFGNDEEPYISKELSSCIEGSDLDISLMVYGKKKAMEEIGHIQKVLPSVRNCYKQINDSHVIHKEKYYHFILSINKTDEARGAFNTIVCFSSLRDTFKQLKERKRI